MKLMNFLGRESSEIERREEQPPFLLLSLFSVPSLPAAEEPTLFGRFFMLYDGFTSSLLLWTGREEVEWGI